MPDAAIKDAAALMKEDRTKSRATVCRLLAESSTSATFSTDRQAQGSPPMGDPWAWRAKQIQYFSSNSENGTRGSRALPSRGCRQPRRGHEPRVIRLARNRCVERVLAGKVYTPRTNDWATAALPRAGRAWLAPRRSRLVKCAIARGRRREDRTGGLRTDSHCPTYRRRCLRRTGRPACP